MDYVQESLIHHEQMLKFKASTVPTSQDAALLGQRHTGPPTCWSCGEVDHVQRFCQKRKGKSPQHGAAVADENDVDDSKSEGAFVTSIIDCAAWLIDSGTSSHMTPNKEYFASYT